MYYSKPSPAPWVLHDGKLKKTQDTGHSLQYAHYLPQHVPAKQHLPAHQYTGTVNAHFLDAFVERRFPGIKRPPLASGSYGSVYVLTIHSKQDFSFQQLIGLHAEGVDMVETYAGATIEPGVYALKVQRAKDPKEFQKLRPSWKHEAKVHAYVNAHVPGLSPIMYLAAVDPQYNVHYTLMQLVQGAPLEDVTITPQIAKNVEAAVTALWKIGIVHADMHQGNVLVLPNGNVAIIDFGMAEVLPSHIRESLQPGDTSEQMWRKIRGYVDSRKKAQGYDWYNPNGKLLQVVYHKASQYSASPTGVHNFGGSRSSRSSSRS